MKVPEELLYTEDHEWVLVEGDQATIGITDHAQAEMGDFVFVELPEVGERFNQFDQFGVVESVKAVSDVYIPVSGEIIETNQSLLDQPELCNQDPYKAGWLIKVRLSEQTEVASLMDKEAYTRFLEEVE